MILAVQDHIVRIPRQERELRAGEVSLETCVAAHFDKHFVGQEQVYLDGRKAWTQLQGDPQRQAVGYDVIQRMHDVGRKDPWVRMHMMSIMNIFVECLVHMTNSVRPVVEKVKNQLGEYRFGDEIHKLPDKERATQLREGIKVHKITYNAET